MNRKTVARTILASLLLAGFLSWAPAQSFEINPYAGGILSPSSTDINLSSFDLKEEGLYGVRGGFFLTRNIQIEGNFGYINHFEFRGSDPESRGILWEASALYHLNMENVKPFVTAGIGGITAIVDEDHPSFAPGSTPLFEDGDTFFTFSYGGGLKAPRLWGPLGLRGDIRGRTIPNLLGEPVTWLELTGGVTLSF